jgi:hypothetical protein
MSGDSPAKAVDPTVDRAKHEHAKTASRPAPT